MSAQLSWKQSLRHGIVSQFHQPRGVLGSLVSWVLAHRPSNRRRNLWTVELLEVGPRDRVLELGCGPGIAVQACARRATAGLVVGIDHSGTVLRAARRRNARAVAEGRVALHCAPFEELPAFAEPFDRIFSVNALQFAGDPDAVLRRLLALLRPSGRIAITFQSRRQGATDADTRRGGEEIAERLRAAGFRDLRSEVLPLEPVAAICVLGTRGDATPREAAFPSP